MQNEEKDLKQAEKKAPRKPANEGESLPSPYSNYQKWRVDVETKKSGENVSGYMFTAVKKIKESVTKLSPDEADRLNTQSHNSRVRYYLEDAVTNGDEETVTI